MREVIGAFCWLALICVTGEVAAQPHIRVRGRGAIAASLTAEDGKLKISGRVTDETGMALSNTIVSLRIEADGKTSRSAVQSGDDGIFERWLEPLTMGEDIRVLAAIEGSSHVDGVEASLVVSRHAPVTLRISLPGKDRVDLDQPSAQIEISSASGAPAALKVDVRDERAALIGSGTLEPNEPLVLSVPSRRFGAQGYGRLQVEAVGDDGTKHPAGAIDVLRYRTSQLRLVRMPAPSATIAGTLADRDGHALAQQAVALLVNGARVATILSNDQGAFHVEPDSRWSTHGSARLEAVHESASPWWIGGYSNAIILPAASAQSPPWWPVALLAAASIAVLAWRQRQGQATRNLGGATLEERDREQQLPPPLGDSTITSVHGTIVDSVSQAPIRDAEIQVASLDDRSTTSDVWGRFHLADLPRGNHMLFVRRAGYEDQSVRLTLPHSGRWHNAVVPLRSLRSVALAHYRRGAQPFPGLDDATQTHTAQELLAIHEHGASDSMRAILRRLTDAFEAAYYAGHAPTRTLVERVRRSADDAEQERRTRIV